MLNWMSRSLIATFLLAFALLMAAFAYYTLTIGRALASSNSNRLVSSTASLVTELPKTTKKETSKKLTSTKRTETKKLSPETNARIQALEAQVKALQDSQSPTLVEKPGATALQSSESHPKNTTEFDAVPADQVKPLVRRMKLVEELVQMYGRAYDYRTRTIAELESILAGLKEKRATAKSAAAAKALPLQKLAPRNDNEPEVGSSSDQNVDPELDQ